MVHVLVRGTVNQSFRGELQRVEDGQVLDTEGAAQLQQGVADPAGSVVHQLEKRTQTVESFPPPSLSGRSETQRVSTVTDGYLINVFHCRPDVLLHFVVFGHFPVGRRKENLIWSRHPGEVKWRCENMYSTRPCLGLFRVPRVHLRKS